MYLKSQNNLDRESASLASTLNLSLNPYSIRLCLEGLRLLAKKMEPELEQVDLVFVAPPAPPSRRQNLLHLLTCYSIELLHFYSI